MTSDELKSARSTIGLSQTDMARTLHTPLRTYQDWEAGVNRIPGIVEVAVTLLAERIKWSVDRAVRLVEEQIDRDFPFGIRSAGVSDGVDSFV